MTQLSPHFTLEEMTRSQLASRTGIANIPAPQAIENLARLCLTLLEPARALLGVPMQIDSGYRSMSLNAAVGGATMSAHQFGRAADVVPCGVDLRVAFDELRASPLPFDQLILECDAWLHLSVAPYGASARRECLLAAGAAGHWTYKAAA